MNFKNIMFYTFYLVIFIILVAFVMFIFIVIFVILFFSRRNLINIDLSSLKKEGSMYIAHVSKFSHSYIFIYIDDNTKKLYFSHSFLDAFKIATSYYYFWFGYFSLEDLHSFKKDRVSMGNLVYSWSWLYELSYISIMSTWFSYKFYFKFFLNLVVFTLLFYMYNFISVHLYPSIYNNLYFSRLFLLVLVSAYVFFLLRGAFKNEFIENFPKLDNYYVKIIPLCFIFIDNLPQIVLRFLNFFFNLMILSYLFTYFEVIALLPYILVSYGILYLCYNLFIYRLRHKGLDRSNYSYFFGSVENKIEGILAMPTATMIIFIIYSIIWWLWFLIGTYFSGHFALALEYFRIRLKGRKEVDLWLDNKKSNNKYFRSEILCKYYFLITFNQIILSSKWGASIAKYRERYNKD